MDNLNAKFTQLGLDYRRKGVLDASGKNLAAGGDHGSLFELIGQEPEYGLLTTHFLYAVQLFFLYDQGDDAGAGKLIALVHWSVAVTRGNHHLPKAIDEPEPPAIDLEEAIDGSAELNFALLDLGLMHIFIFTQIA